MTDTENIIRWGYIGIVAKYGSRHDVEVIF